MIARAFLLFAVIMLHSPDGQSAGADADGMPFVQRGGIEVPAVSCAAAFRLETALLFGSRQDASERHGTAIRALRARAGVMQDSVDLTVVGNGRRFELHWIAPPEFSCFEYRVERAWSPDFRITASSQWLEIGRIAGICNVAEYIPYSFTDEGSEELSEGSVQYRLLLRTLTGEEFYVYSDELLVAVPERIEIISVYPQPASGEVTVLLTSPSAAQLRVRIHDTVGRVVHSKDREIVSSGLHSIPLRIDGLPSGMYILELRTDRTAAQRALRIRR